MTKESLTVIAAATAIAAGIWTAQTAIAARPNITHPHATTITSADCGGGTIPDGIGGCKIPPVTPQQMQDQGWVDTTGMSELPQGGSNEDQAE